MFEVIPNTFNPFPVGTLQGATMEKLPLTLLTLIVRIPPWYYISRTQRPSSDRSSPRVSSKEQIMTSWALHVHYLILQVQLEVGLTIPSILRTPI